jgi:hypothetical protein
MQGGTIGVIGHKNSPWHKSRLVAVNLTLRNEVKLRKEFYMNKKMFGIALVLLVLFTVGTVFAQSVCNYYESGTDKISAEIISVDGKTAKIWVKSFVRGEPIEIYQVVVNGVTFTYREIVGPKMLQPHGETTITVTKTGTDFPRRPTFKVYLKTCE